MDYNPLNKMGKSKFTQRVQINEYIENVMRNTIMTDFQNTIQQNTYLLQRGKE